MGKLIFDCDNTMGLQNRDIDDGLALLYILGRDDIELLGLTTTYGNSTIDLVYQTTQQMLKTLGLYNISLFKGAGSVGNNQSEGARFLAETADKHSGEVTVLTTGSLTNLYQAYQIDPDFFRHLKKSC